MLLLLLLLVLAGTTTVVVQGVTVVPTSCDPVSSTTESITFRWNAINCQGQPQTATVYPPSNPCVGTVEVNPLVTNQITYQVCDDGDTRVCPVVQLYQSGPLGPPLDGSTLTCAAIDAANANFAPVEAGTDFAIPAKCYNLPLGVGSIRYLCGRAAIPDAWLPLLPPPSGTTVATTTTRDTSGATTTTTVAPATVPPDAAAALAACKACATAQVLGGPCPPSNPLLEPCLADPVCTSSCLLPFTADSWQPPVSPLCRALDALDLTFSCVRPGCSPLCDAFIGPVPPRGCATYARSTWYNARNDRCQCLEDCIQCHNGGTAVEVPLQGNSTQGGYDILRRTCACPTGTATVDCLGCTSACACGEGQVCDTKAVATTAGYARVYKCARRAVPTSTATLVWNALPDGTATLIEYASAASTPIVRQCKMARCTSTYSGNQQRFSCAATSCAPGSQLVNDPVSDSVTTFTIPVGAPATLSQQGSPTTTLDCTASGCVPMCNCTAAVVPEGCVQSTDSSLWFQLRNDTCQCPWNCIQCNGGLPVPARGTVQTPGQDGPHTCACSSSAATMDCLGCTATGCPAEGSVCDTSVFVTNTKAYSCLPDPNLSTFFEGGGLFIFEVRFVDSSTTTGGTVRLSVYADPLRTPLLFTCSLWNCERSIDGGNQKIQCANTNCTATGSDKALAQIVESLFGVSTVILKPDGTAQMFQQQVVLTIEMSCSASGCRFPGDSEVRQSTLATALAAAFGVAAILAIIALLLYCVWRSKQLKQKYLQFGKRRIERTVTWEAIACTLTFRVPSHKVFHVGERRTLEVLKPLSGEARPGTMTALMGESGAGKTALLDMLARRKTFGAMRGSVLVNGRPPGDDWKRITGYVLQDDIFIPTQTAREHLMFAANLKLPAIMTHEERVERVAFVLEQMGLTSVADSLIGDMTRKGLSGGEKKRLSIATELIADPSVLFIDEPTSGLDSVNGLRVMQGLYTLAKEHGKTIIFSIHAPDSRLFELFDQVIILAKGYLMFFGPRERLQPAMEALAGRACPPHYNPADFAIHTVAAFSNDMPHLDEVHQHMPLTRDIDQSFSDNAVELGDFSPVVTRDDDETSAMAAAALLESERLGAYTQPWLWQVGYTCQRSLVDAVRNPYLLRLQYILILAASLALGGLFFQMDLTAAGAQNRLGLLFFVVVLLMVITLPSIDTFFAERALFMREKAAGYYSSSAYFVAKAVADVVPLRLIPPIILTCIVYPMTGLRLQTAAYFFWFMLIVVLLSFCATGLCLLISSLAPSVAVGNLAAILVMLFEMLFGGLLLSTSSLPSGIAWLKWVSFIFYAYNALMVNEFTNLTFYVDSGVVKVPLNGQFFLNFFGLESSAFYLCVYLLIVQGFCFYLVAGIVLYFRKEKR